MKLNCFIDETGKVYSTEALHKAAENLPISRYEINDSLLEELIHWQLNNFNDYLIHYKRTIEADLSKPIIVRSDGYIMDGWHRVIKAIYTGKKSLPAKKFINDPEPDSE